MSLLRYSARRDRLSQSWAVTHVDGRYWAVRFDPYGVPTITSGHTGRTIAPRSAIGDRVVAAVARALESEATE